MFINISLKFTVIRFPYLNFFSNRVCLLKQYLCFSHGISTHTCTTTDGGDPFGKIVIPFSRDSGRRFLLPKVVLLMKFHPSSLSEFTDYSTFSLIVLLQKSQVFSLYRNSYKD